MEQNKVQADQIRRLKSMLASKSMNRKEHVETLKERVADKIRTKEQDEKLSRQARNVWRMMKGIVARKMKINEQAEVISMQESKIKRLTKLWRLRVQGAHELRKENGEMVDERLDFEGRMANAVPERRVMVEAWRLCAEFLEDTGLKGRITSWMGKSMKSRDLVLFLPAGLYR